MADNITDATGQVRVTSSFEPTGGVPGKIAIDPVGSTWDAYKRAWGLEVKVNCEAVWTAAVTAGSDWLSVARVYTTKLELTLAENTTGAARTGTITITAQGGETATLTVTQSASNPIEFSLSVSEITIPAEGGKVEFALTSLPSTPWDATCLSDWAKVIGLVQKAASEEEADVWDYKYTGITDATLAIRAEANTGKMERRVNVTFRQGIKKQVLTVIQPAPAAEETATA